MEVLCIPHFNLAKWMFAVNQIHPDNNSIKSANLRHNFSYKYFFKMACLVSLITFSKSFIVIPSFKRWLLFLSNSSISLTIIYWICNGGIGIFTSFFKIALFKLLPKILLPVLSKSINLAVNI